MNKMKLLFENLFARWETVVEYPVLSTYLHFWNISKETTTITIQKHSKSGKLRAYNTRNHWGSERVNILSTLKDLKEDNPNLYRRHFNEHTNIL